MEEEQKVPNSSFHPDPIDFEGEEEKSRPQYQPAPDINLRGPSKRQTDEVVFEDDRDRSPMAQRGNFDDEDSPAVAARQSISDISNQRGSQQKK